MRLIDADKLREDMLLALCGTGYQSVGLREIDFAPTVEAKPIRHGHWNYKYPIDGKPYRYCSECLEIVYDDTVAKNYCPACGSKMD